MKAKNVIVVSLAIIIGALLLFFAGALRTFSFGVEIELLVSMLVGFSIFSALVSFFLFGNTRKTYLVAFLITFFMLLLVEGYVGLQEVIVSQNNECPHTEVRWWPYQNQEFFCSQEGRWRTPD